MSIFDIKVTNGFDSDFDFNKDGKLDLSEQSIQYEYIRQRMEGFSTDKKEKREDQNCNNYVANYGTTSTGKTSISKKIGHFFSTWGIFLFNAVMSYFLYREYDWGYKIYGFFIGFAIFNLPIFLLMARDD